MPMNPTAALTAAALTALALFWPLAEAGLRAKRAPAAHVRVARAAR